MKHATVIQYGSRSGTVFVEMPDGTTYKGSPSKVIEAFTIFRTKMAELGKDTTAVDNLLATLRRTTS